MSVCQLSRIGCRRAPSWWRKIWGHWRAEVHGAFASSTLIVCCKRDMLGTLHEIRYTVNVKNRQVLMFYFGLHIWQPLHGSLGWCSALAPVDEEHLHRLIWLLTSRIECHVNTRSSILICSLASWQRTTMVICGQLHSLEYQYIFHVRVCGRLKTVYC